MSKQVRVTALYELVPAPDEACEGCAFYNNTCCEEWMIATCLNQDEEEAYIFKQLDHTLSVEEKLT